MVGTRIVQDAKGEPSGNVWGWKLVGCDVKRTGVVFEQLGGTMSSLGEGWEARLLLSSGHGFQKRGHASGNTSFIRAYMSKAARKRPLSLV